MLDESLILALSMSALALCLTGLQDSSIRGAISPDGVHVFSVYDFIINQACLKNLKSSNASVTLSNLIEEDSEYTDEVVKALNYRKSPDGGNRETPTMTIRGLQRLLMILGGNLHLQGSSKFQEGSGGHLY